jgi:photosystem II stability/assembly factor-like uncharacterized protein
MQAHAARALFVAALAATNDASRIPPASAVSPTEPFCGADGGRGELNIYGAVTSIAVSPTGKIWIPTRTGRTYFTDDVLGDWSAGKLAFSSDDDFSTPCLDRISFFNTNVAFASGYISTSHGSVQDTIYRTIDGGESWAPVHFPANEWIYTAFVTPGGKAWMGGSSGNFLYSSDFAASWTLRSSPFTRHDERTHAIFMTESGNGVIGSLRGGLKLTSDNGGSWRSIPSPLDQKAYNTTDDRSDHRIEKVAFFGGFLLAEQDGRVFASRQPIRWRALTPALIDLAVDPGSKTFVGITAGRELFEFASDLTATPLLTKPLPAFPIDMEFTNSAVYVFDSNREVYEVRDHVLRGSRPLTSTGPRADIRVVRQGEGLLWGTTGGEIYNSNDEGRSWCRRGPTGGAMVGFDIRPDGHLILWDGHGTNVEFDPSAHGLRNVNSFGSDDVIEIIPSGNLWVAYGGMQYETTQRIEVARTYFSGQFHGSVDHGFVYLSEDAGMTWALVDRWISGGVADLFVASPGEIYLLSYLGAVRKLVRRDARWEAIDLIVANADTRDKVPYVERPFAFYFADANHGFVGGWIHHIGNRYFETTDGGRTWTRVEEAQFPYSRITPFQGSYLAIKGRDLGRLKVLDFTPIDLSTRVESNEAITDLTLDRKGRLLIQLTQVGKYGYPDGATRWRVLDLPAN